MVSISFGKMSGVASSKTMLEPITYSQPFTADIERIKSILFALPPANASALPAAAVPSVQLSLPAPEDGKYLRFALEEVAIMHPDLAARYPDIKTYRGLSVDGSGATLAFDITPAGMRRKSALATARSTSIPFIAGTIVFMSAIISATFSAIRRASLSFAKRLGTPAAFLSRTAGRRLLPVPARSCAPIGWLARLTARLPISPAIP